MPNLVTCWCCWWRQGSLTPCEAREDEDPDHCSPWADTFGFFFGDGSHDTLVMKVTEVNHVPDILGNYIRGTSLPISHTYGADKLDANTPWVAFFTGGDRLTKTSGPLNNNNHGRFRLEVRVFERP
jgi:hypothetical protein